MAKKPTNLIYGVDDRPPVFTTLILGLQHVFVLFIALIFPVLIVRQLGSSISPDWARGFISLSMIAGGAATVLQAFTKGPVGSGYLCPSVCGPSYFDASKIAAATGGLPLLFGMTAVAGIIECLFSRVIHRLRVLFPSEVTGVVVAMVGIVVIPISVKNFFGYEAGDLSLRPAEISTGLVTFFAIIALSVWSRGKLKLYCTLVGMVVGYGISALLGIITADDLEKIRSAPVFALPRPDKISWAFDFSLVIPFTVATLCSTFKTVGDLVTCQKINDSDWRRPDMNAVSRGILADGLGGVIPGIIGGYGQSTSSSNVGLSVATGATSRVVAFAVGAIFISLAFFPKLAELFLIMPKPVIGATLIFAVSFMIVAGFQIMMSRMMDARKTFVVGASIIFGLSADMAPELYRNVHPWVKPVFASSLSLATMAAILLNLLLRIGISRQAVLELNVATDSSEKIFEFMEHQGRSWGARPEVIHSAASALNEFLEGASLVEVKEGKVKVKAEFDEFKLDMTISYRGEPLELALSRPSKEELKREAAASTKLSGYMIRQYTDAVRQEKRDDMNLLFLHFEH
ncbi:MAG TPA: solute carrier family 23 protein [Syntrophorhabdaceae bacterium]|jgi:NCS2 family nucleobase:cation symporter-2